VQAAVLEGAQLAAHPHHDDLPVADRNASIVGHVGDRSDRHAHQAAPIDPR
jgi:hypothetical protein